MENQLSSCFWFVEGKKSNFEALFGFLCGKKDLMFVCRGSFVFVRLFL